MLTEPYAVGEAECNDCRKKWTAVWPLDADDLECPQCGGFNTERRPLFDYVNEKESDGNPYLH